MRFFNSHRVDTELALKTRLSVMRLDRANVKAVGYAFVTQRRSVAKNVGRLQRRLCVCVFVCQHDNF